MTVKDVCQAAGMPKSSFYYILAQNAKAIAELQEQLIGDVRVRLASLLGNRFELLEKVIADSLNDKTKVRDRLAIMKYLDTLQDKIMQRLSIDNSANMDASEFLRGPHLSIQKSRMTAYASEGEDEG